MQLFYIPNIEQHHFLPEQEARHALKVRRLKPHTIIHIFDGQGNLWEAKILNDDYKQCKLEILDKQYIPKKRDFEVHIALAPTKNIDRTEWFVEKATEIGIDSLSFLLCEHSERKQIKLERLTKIVISACKQSLKTHLPKINALEKFEDFIKQDWTKQEKYIAYINKNEEIPMLKKIVAPQQSYLVLIGPEGGFSKNEIILAKNHNFQTISLGQERLRTETASLVACHTFHVLN